ncbi:MAG: hypothetical protein ACRDT4_27340, partial [Micromonosporaceae bacterium]
MNGQLSLLDADVAPAGPEDLEGLLAGPGQIVRLGGTARVSVVVAEQWRAAALLAEFASRGLAGSHVSTVDEHIGVRTAYAAALAPVAARWLRGAVLHPPSGFGLDGRRLRLWALAAGSADSRGYVLGLSHPQGHTLGRGDEEIWRTTGKALAAAGLAATLVGRRSGGPAFRIIGRRRLVRL